ncbi:RNA polymerase sigma factor [Lacipirellula sp.]|uniref:RNA polymerase sigma factor n=1 Tax=Lacipirellula sp. TaxID=2691419 RepID=UPI003D0BAB05
MTADSFEGLMRQASCGSEEAVWLLLDRYSKNILRVVRRHLPSELRSKVDSTDIVQSVWKSLIRKGAKFDEAATPEKLVAYLAGMAKFKVYETHRHYTTTKAFDLGREQSLSRPGDGDAAAINSRPDADLHDTRAQEPLEIISTRENWQRAINNSGDRGRQIVELRLQGLTYEEVAERLNISVSTVRRALDSLLESLSS